MAFDITEFDVWKAWITIGEAFQESKFLPRYDENALLYRGPESVGTKAKRDLTVNTVGPTVESLVSSYYARNPKPIVTPKRAEFKVRGSPEALKGEDAARLIEDLVYHTFEEKHVKQEIKAASISAELGGYGGVELGWSTKIQRIEIPKEFSGTGRKEKISSEFLSHISSEGPYVKFRKPKQWLFPPHAPDWQSMPFLILWEDVPVDMVISEENFTKSAKDAIKERLRSGTRFIAGSVAGEDGQKPFYGAEVDMNRVGGSPEFGTMRIYHCWDLKRQRYFVMPEIGETGVKEFLRVEDWPYKKMEGYPASFLVFTPDPDEFYPIAPVDWYRDQAREKNTLRRRMLQAVDKAVAKILTQSRDEEEINRVRKAGQGDIAQVKNIEQWKEIILSAIPPQWMQLEAIINNDVVRSSGLTEQRMNMPSSSDLATDIVQRERAFATRSGAKQDALKEFIQDIAKKVWQLWAEHATDKHTIRISRDGGINFREFGREDIQGEYDFEIDITTAAQDAPEQKAQQVGTLLQLAQGFPEIGTDGRRELLHRLMNAIKTERPESIVPPAQDPDARGLATLEFQSMLLTGQPIDPMEGQNHEEHSKQHMLDLQYIQAKQQLGPLSEPEMKAGMLLGDHLQKTLMFMAPGGAVVPPGQGPQPKRSAQPPDSQKVQVSSQALEAQNMTQT